MNANDKARQLINERGYDRAIRLALLQRRGATDRTTREYWHRVLVALIPSPIGNAATAAYELDADLPEGE